MASAESGAEAVRAHASRGGDVIQDIERATATSRVDQSELPV